MFKNFFKPLGSILFIMLATFLVSCGGGGGGGGGGNPNPPPPPTIISIDITPDNGPVIGIPGQQQFTAIANYTNGTHKDVTTSATWASSNPSVATIGADGKATAVAFGTTTIQATFESVASEQVTLTVGNILISASTKLPYSIPISESRATTFLVQNLTDNTTYQLGTPIVSVNGYGSAVIDSGATTCGSQLPSHESCIYAVTYTSPSDITKSGTLSDVKLEVNIVSFGTIQASTTTFIANGTANLQNGASPIAVPTKVMVLYNSDPKNTLYPVIETSRKLSPNFDSWLMAFFQESNTPIYISGVYRIYIGGESGIAPGQYAEIPLPLYSRFNSLQPSGDNYIDWWRGTRFYLYDNPVGVKLRKGVSDTQVSNSLIAESIGSTKICYTTTYNQPSCHDVPSVIYLDNTNNSLPDNDPSQLVEPTLGSDGGIGNFKWNGTEIDYDVSYVNDLYLPLSLGKIDYTDQTLGWVGTDNPIQFFQESALSRPFMSLNPTQGLWPVYIYSTAVESVLNASTAAGQIKIPSPIQTLFNPYVGLPPGDIPSNGLDFRYNRQKADGTWMIQTESDQLDYVNKMLNAWQTGINNNVESIVTIWNAFESNYNVNCPAESAQPATLSYLLANIVGFSSVGVCSNKQASLGIPLPNASESGGLALIKAYHGSMNVPGQPLNPWVSFIHQDNELGLQSVYAYSIDDALGNVQTAGDGMIIEVGGKKAQENPQMMLPADKTIILAFSGLPLNAYVYTNATVCGLPVLGETQVDQESSTNPNRPAYHGKGIIGNTYPIYLPAASNGKSCKITITGQTLIPLFDQAGHEYAPGTAVNADFTVGNAVYPRSIAGGAALTNSMQASCNDNIGKLFCQGVNATTASTSVLYTIQFPG